MFAIPLGILADELEKNFDEILSEAELRARTEEFFDRLERERLAAAVTVKVEEWVI